MAVGYIYTTKWIPISVKLMKIASYILTYEPGISEERSKHIPTTWGFSL